MRDPRVHILVLVILTVAHSIASDRMVAWLAASTALVAFVHLRSFLRGIRVITVTVVSLGLFGFIVWIAGLGVKADELVLGLVRWISLVVLTVVIVLSLNTLDIITSLVFFRVPSRIALAFGAGFRFLPVIFDEAHRIQIVHRQYGLWFSWSALRKYGFFGLVNRLTSPLLIALLRRVDSLVISIELQQVELRVKEHKFVRWNLTDICATIAALGLCIISWAVR